MTNVVLMASLSERATGAVNRWLEAHDHPPLLEVTAHWQGHKAFECEVWLGAFNYLAIGEFIKACQALRWETRALLAISDQEGVTTTWGLG